MLGKYCSIDFEFKNSKNPRYTLISAALTDGVDSSSVWLHDRPTSVMKLKEYMLSIRDTHVLLSFSVDAEARSLISMGLNPIKFKWIDLQAEWSMLTNHNDKMAYGKQLIIMPGGNTAVEKTTYRKPYGDNKCKKAHDKCSKALLACTYKLLGTVGPKDVEYKARMRDIILKNEIYTESMKKEILDYGSKDISELKDIYEAMLKEYKRLLPKSEYVKLYDEMLYRGDTVARAAVIASTGYPVPREKVVKFSKNVKNIVKDCQEDINSQFEDFKPFIWKKNEDRFGWKQKETKEWLAENVDVKTWRKTATGALSLGLDAFEDKYSYRHNFPKGNLPAQLLRYLRLNQSLNGFKPKSVTARDKTTFFSYYGDDDRAHPYLNAYGAQSARYQPRATGFIHLKAAWMRSLVEPKPGRSIAGIDYGSEEFLIAALMSEDQNMIDAYASGDVYLYFAKLAGAVPWEGTKKQYKAERDRFKSTVLGISYGMGAKSLAAKITVDTGVETSVEEAQELINMFRESFPEYIMFIREMEQSYWADGYLKLPCGWYMFGDNDNVKSVGNMPVQGVGSSILRKAIELAQDAGLEVIVPLHDAAYIEFDTGDLSAVDTLADCMTEAFAFYFDGEFKKKAEDLIRLDVDVWGPDYEWDRQNIDGEWKNLPKYFNTEKGLTVKAQPIYIDERAGDEYEQFSKYFQDQVS